MSRLAIFDIDGTLCDTNDVDDECFVAAARETLGLDGERLDWRGCPDVTDAGIVRWYWREHRGHLPAPSEVAAFRDRFVARLEERLREEPSRFGEIRGAASLLTAARSDRWEAVIATGGWSRSARLKLAAAGLPGEGLLASSDDSPDRIEIFRLAHRRAVERRGGGDYERVVLVGDGVWDVQVAASLGWAFAGVGREERAERLRRAGASTVVEDFYDSGGFLALLERCEVPTVPLPSDPR